MSAVSVLNEQQACAVHARGHVLVISVPGSGKTRLLVSKAVKILRADPNAKVVLVTFTRDAAEEMSTRLVAELGLIPKNVHIGTFHSLAIELLKNRSKKINVLSPDKQTSFLWRAYSRICDNADPDEWLSWESAVRAIEHIKSQLDPVVTDRSVTGRIYLSYQTLLADNAGMDFADLMLESVRAMRTGSIATFACQYLFVDEAQDTDEVQMAWIDCHIASGAEVTMVADDDQSIYSWRNALGYKGILEFERRYRAQRIILSTNYRSATHIIEAANRLIQHNSDRLPKTIRANTSNRGVVRYSEHRTRQDEAYAVVSTIARNPQEWVVLARANYQLDTLAAVLKKERITHHQPGVFQFWGRQHIAKPLTTLWSLSLDGTGHRDESVGVEQLLASAGVDENIIRARRPVTFGQMMEFEQLVVLDERKNFRKMLGFVDTWRKQSASTIDTDIATVFHAVYDWFSEHAPVMDGPGGQNRKRPSGLQARQMAIAGTVLSRMRGSLRERIENIREPMKTDGPRVALLTIHATKGLEFDRVWVVGAEEGSLPFRGSNIEEERRLCYVAITRARKEVVLSSVIRDEDRRKESAIPSQFIDQAGIRDPAIAATA